MCVKARGVPGSVVVKDQGWEGEQGLEAQRFERKKQPGGRRRNEIWEPREVERREKQPGTEGVRGGQGRAGREFPWGREYGGSEEHEINDSSEGRRGT